MPSLGSVLSFLRSRVPLLRKGAGVGAAQGYVQVATFLRGAIVARLISPEDFGLAATFTITVAFLEMTSNLSIENFLVQSPHGDDPPLQTTAQFVLFLRGLAIALVLLVAADPIARFFNAPQTAKAFRFLSLIPLMRGLVHLDPCRVQRHMSFAPSLIPEIAGITASLAAAWPLGKVFGDYMVMPVLLLLQTLVQLVASHLVSHRAYRWGIHQAHAERLFSFGWPLLLNGLLLFGIFQGDRLVIASSHFPFFRSSFTMADLGVYSAAFSLALAPTLFTAKVLQTVLMPLLARAQDDPADFRRLYHQTLLVTNAAAGLMGIPMVALGGAFISLVFGERYQTGFAVMTWLVMMATVRNLRVAPTLAALVKGDTKNPLYGNVVRSLAIVGMVLSAALGGSLASIAFCGFAGECGAYLTSVLLLRRKFGLPLRENALTLVCLGGMSLAILVAVLQGGAEGLWAGTVRTAVPLAAFGAAMLPFASSIAEGRGLFPLKRWTR